MISHSNRHRSRNAISFRMAVCLLMVGVSGCITGPARTSRIPRFDKPLSSPVVIQVLDERPEVESGSRASEEWIYYGREPETQAEQLGRLLGNGLNTTGATPGYRYASPAFPLEERVEYGLKIHYLHGYSRWPVEPDQNRRQVPVEGRCEVKVELWTRGERVRTLRVEGEPADFEVSVAIINRGNVRRIVGDSLEHQYEKAVTDMLDVLMARLADDWKAFRNGEVKGGRTGARGLTPSR